MKQPAIFLSAVVIAWSLLVGAKAAVTAEAAEFFEKRIRPVLVERCYECHTEGRKTKGGLALDTREGLRRGGDNGPSLVPGEPEKSLLIEAVRYRNRDLQMPPKGALTDAQVRDLEEWVKMGAPDPREARPAIAARKSGMSLEEGRKFWAFQPVAPVQPPAVKNDAWVKSPVDAFILAELEKHRLEPAPAADKRTLLRRATFDLTGLPPTPAELEAFLADDSPDAFARVVDRLLASPQYGERWGRHWLDVARYADSNGMDENVAYGHAWRYRDYVVKAFNSDKPFDQFIVEQIAGDLLPAGEQPTREESLTGTGFLALGARVLAEPDVRKLEMDIIDEQLDTIGKAFLGMTFGCARCHDHKFDPVTQADYYAMAAIFRSTKSLADEKMGAIKFWYEHSLATPAQLEAKKKHEALVKEHTARVTKFSAETRARLKDELHARAADYLAAAAELAAEPDWEEVQKVAARAALRPRYLLTCRQYLARKPDHPVLGKWREFVAAGKIAELRAHFAGLFGRAAAALAEAKAKDAKATAPADAALAAVHAALHDTAGFLAIPTRDEDAFDEQMLATAAEMRAQVKVLEDQTPDPPALMGVRDDKITPALAIHIRGSYLTLGAEVERGFPEVMRTSLTRPIFPARQSGRLQLARWIASSDHPLTARVAVNRLWRWHFGRGLVGSTENFGVLGEKPSHPALLDWLARRFVEEGWSLKALHRLLMNSSTYQMASVHPGSGRVSTAPDPASVDPENRLLWRAPVQRLEAEQIRDALLAVSDSLDPTRGGKTIPLRNREFVFNHTSRDHTTYETTRRALYLPIIRNHLYDLLEQFDYPDPTMPTGSRNATVVAPQALIMLNAPVVRMAAERLAEALANVCGDDASRVQQAYERAYGRPPTGRETERALAFLRAQAPSAERWTLLCHTLLASNEFIYLR